MSDFTTSATFRYLVNVLYVKDSTGGVRIETEQIPQVRPGDLVEAAGFPSVTPGKPILRNAVLRVLGAGSVPTASDIAGINVLTPDYDAELVRIDGQLLSVVGGTTERVLVLRRGDTIFNAGLDVSQPGDAVDAIRPGSRLSITGVVPVPGWAATVVPAVPAVTGRCAGHRGGAVVDDPAYRGDGRDPGA